MKYFLVLIVVLAVAAHALDTKFLEDAEEEAAVSVVARTSAPTTPPTTAPTTAPSASTPAPRATKAPIRRTKMNSTPRPKGIYTPAPTHAPYVKRVLVKDARRVKDAQAKVAAAKLKVKETEDDAAHSAKYLEKQLESANVGRQRIALDTARQNEEKLSKAKEAYRDAQDEYEQVVQDHAKLQGMAQKSAPEPVYLGCYRDTPQRALPHNRGTVHRSLFTNYQAVSDCATRTFEAGDDVFGLQNDGECWTGKGRTSDYAKYGLQTDVKKCNAPLGSGWTNQVYSIYPVY